MSVPNLQLTECVTTYKYGNKYGKPKIPICFVAYRHDRHGLQHPALMNSVTVTILLIIHNLTQSLSHPITSNLHTSLSVQYFPDKPYYCDCCKAKI